MEINIAARQTIKERGLNLQNLFQPTQQHFENQILSRLITQPKSIFAPYISQQEMSLLSIARKNNKKSEMNQPPPKQVSVPSLAEYVVPQDSNSQHKLMSISIVAWAPKSSSSSSVPTPSPPRFTKSSSATSATSTAPSTATSRSLMVLYLSQRIIQTL